MTRSTAEMRTADDLGAEFLRAMPPPLRLLFLEQDGRIADRDQVPVRQRMVLGDLRPVDERAVVALKILDEELSRPLPDLAMAAGAVAVAGDGDVALGAAPQHGYFVDQGDDFPGQPRGSAPDIRHSDWNNKVR